MPYKILKKSKPEYDPTYIQKKIELIEKGMPIDIDEEEVKALEDCFRGALSFYLDLLVILEDHRRQGKNVEEDYACEAKNLAGVSIALRKLAAFRTKHSKEINRKV